MWTATEIQTGTFGASRVSTHSTSPSCMFSPGVARLAFSRSLAEISSPSDCVKQFSTVKRTVENPSGPRYGRPSDRFGPPTALFNKELAILKHDLEHLETLTPDLPTVDNAFRLVCSSTEIYVSEEARKSRVQEILRQLLPGGGKWQEKVADGAAKPDGIWLKESFAYLIFELKNEQGMFGDPFLHTLIVYSKIVSQKNVTPSPPQDSSTNAPRTVCQIHSPIEPAHRFANPGRESSRGIDCHIHQRHLCGQITLHRAHARASRSRERSPCCAYFRGGIQMCSRTL